MLFADDTSVSITSYNPREFNIITDEILQKSDTWFKINLLSLNFDKTHFIHFKTKNIQTTEVKVKYKDKLINPINNI
jgi:capsule polysaccharide export protein KpsE/RkpR